MKQILFIGLLAFLALSCQFVKNDRPLIDQNPTLVKTITNGQKYIIGNPKDESLPYLYIANVKGTPREMGRAIGELFAEEIDSTIKLFYGYYLGQLEQIIETKLPVFLATKVTGGVKKLLNTILDLNIRITKRYTNPRYYEEIKGMAEGAKGKVNEQNIKRLNLFPQLIKAACTVAGVWKEAALKNHTLHIRSLDWDQMNPISKNPTVLVYHPSDPKLHSHANFGWAGFVGSMTGMSEKVSIGEKVWYPPSNSVKMTRYGNPWTYVFRDILYEASNIKTALALLTNTHRTCAIHVGLGSVEDQSFRMLEYSKDVLNNYDDSNYTHYAANHPKKAGIAYFDKHVQPSGDGCLGEIFTNPSFYGKWDAQSLYRYIGLTHTTGDTQLAVFDLTSMLAYVSYSSPDGKEQAYRRSPIRIDMEVLFKPF